MEHIENAELSQYLKITDEMKQHKETFERRHHDFTIEFCEQYGFIEEFIACKMQPLAFYAYAKYKVKGLPIEKLKEAIKIINV